MNEIAASTSLSLAWVFGILFGVLSVLIGVVWQNLERRLHRIEENFVSKETLDRVERTWRDAIEAANAQRREMHQENKETMKESVNEIKESISDIHRRIDEEFRELRKRQAQH